MVRVVLDAEADQHRAEAEDAAGMRCRGDPREPVTSTVQAAIVSVIEITAFAQSLRYAFVRVPRRASTASTSCWISRNTSPPLANEGRRGTAASRPPDSSRAASRVELDIARPSLVMDTRSRANVRPPAVRGAACRPGFLGPARSR